MRHGSMSFISALFLAMLVRSSSNGISFEFIVWLTLSIAIAVVWLIIAGRDSEIRPLAALALLGAALALVALGLWLLALVGPVVTLSVTALVTSAAVLGTIRARSTQRLHREVAGLCPECGYDLRASHERCPECGAPIPEELARRRRLAVEIARGRRDRSPADMLPSTPPASPDAVRAQDPPDPA